jgi:hypothetical protein
MIVTPVGLVTQSLFLERPGTPPQLRPAEAAPALEGQLSAAVRQFGPTLQVWRTSGVVIMLDSVTFANGAVVGPDTYNVIDEAVSQRRAAIEIADQLANPKLSDQALAEWLAVEVRQRNTNPSRSDGSVDHYGFRMRTLAASTLQNLKIMSRDQLSRSLREFADANAGAQLHRTPMN